MDGRVVDALVEGGVDLVRSQVIIALFEGREADARVWWARMGTGVEAGKEAARSAAPPIAPPITGETPVLRKSISHLGQTRRCRVCGASKGVTGFAAGEDTCRQCVKSGRTQGDIPLRKVMDPGMRLAKCDGCGKWKPVKEVEGGRCGKCRLNPHVKRVKKG